MSSPNLDRFQKRTEQHEPAVVRAVLAWIAGLRANVSIDDVILALASGSATGILQALNRAKRLVLDLLPVAQAEGQAALDEIASVNRLELRFDVHDPRFLTAVEQQGAKAVQGITLETQAAIQKLVMDAYRQGQHPRVIAPAVREAVGLTTRDASAVLRMFNAQVEQGVRPDLAQRNADRYAERLGKRRAKTIAITETVHAHNIARRESWLQAQRHGLFMGRRPMEEWQSVQTDPKEICYQMNGQRTPLGSDFDGLYPGFVHPLCRCQSIIVLE